jgi:Sucrase/ferredoxin-like
MVPFGDSPASVAAASLAAIAVGAYVVWLQLRRAPQESGGQRRAGAHAEIPTSVSPSTGGGKDEQEEEGKGNGRAEEQANTGEKPVPESKGGEHDLHCHEETRSEEHEGHRAHDVPVTSPAERLKVAMEDCDCGFGRPMDENLVSSVGDYNRHVFVATGHAAWPSNVTGPVTEARLATFNAENGRDLTKEDADSAQAVLRAFSGAMRTARPALKENGFAVKVNACDAPEGRKKTREEESEGSVDLLVFPDNVRVCGVTEAAIPQVVDALTTGSLSGDTETIGNSLRVEPLDAVRHIFVCAHADRDSRCGMCGPALVGEFEKEIEKMQQHERVSVFKCSHVGGHVYAGNVLSFPAGNWWGYVAPEAVPAILGVSLATPAKTDENSFANYEINVRRLWRGQMGVPSAEIQTIVDGWLAEEPGRVSW